VRRPPSPAQVELPLTLVALAAAIAALVQACFALLLKAPTVHPHWARPAGAGILAVAALVSLGIGRLASGPSRTPAVRGMRWAALGLVLAAAVIALAAELSSG